MVASTLSPFLTIDKYFSGNFTSTFRILISSSVAIIEFSPPNIPGVISLFPTLPEKGAIITSPSFRFAMIESLFTDGYLSKSIESAKKFD